MILLITHYWLGKPSHLNIGTGVLSVFPDAVVFGLIWWLL